MFRLILIRNKENHWGYKYPINILTGHSRFEISQKARDVYPSLSITPSVALLKNTGFNSNNESLPMKYIQPSKSKIRNKNIKVVREKALQKLQNAKLNNDGIDFIYYL